MEREVLFFCGEAVVSYRVADVAELERKASPTFFFFALLRSVWRCFALLRFRLLRFVLLGFANALFCFISLWSA